VGLEGNERKGEERESNKLLLLLLVCVSFVRQQHYGKQLLLSFVTKLFEETENGRGNVSLE